MIIRKSFSKFATKKAILLGAVSLLLIGSGAAATQASFNDSGSTQITGSAPSLYIWDWGVFEYPTFNDVMPNQSVSASSTFTNFCNCNIEASPKLSLADIPDQAILDATTITIKINGTSIYNGPLRNISSSAGIRLGPSAAVPIEVTVTVDHSRLNQNQIMNKVPIKFQVKSIPSL